MLSIETPDYEIIDTLPELVEVRKYTGAITASTSVASGIGSLEILVLDD